MNANSIENSLAQLKAELKQANQPKNEPAKHSARHLYFEVQRLTHQYSSRPIAEKLS